MSRLLALLLAVSSVPLVTGCATAQLAQTEKGAFTVKDYLKTAYDTLLVADPDTEGHRIRAQLETRAALASFDDSVPFKPVPYAGPPSLAVALELLERSTLEDGATVVAQTHTQRALAELRQALTRR